MGVIEMSKSKLINELIKQYIKFVENPDNKEINAYFLGFIDSCKIVLTEEQVLVALNEGVK
jgi:hypothetical protein